MYNRVVMDMTLRFLLLVRHGDYARFKKPFGLTDGGKDQLRQLIPKLKRFTEDLRWKVLFGSPRRHGETKDLLLEILGDAPAECKDRMVGHDFEEIKAILEYVKEVIADGTTETLILSTSEPVLEFLPKIVFQELLSGRVPFKTEFLPHASTVVIDLQEKTMQLIYRDRPSAPPI